MRSNFDGVTKFNKLFKRRALGILIISFVFIAGMLGQAHAAIPSSERQALIALYDATAGDGWTDNTGWKATPLGEDDFAQSGSECGWFGVVCDGDTVVQLNLFTNNLVGTIPSALQDLTNLEILSLYGNQLSGGIPAELGNLVNLTKLTVSQNQLTGNIPTDLEKLVNLEFLYLYSNQLDGGIPAGLNNLTKLKHLYLNDNLLDGPIPDLGALVDLEHLYLSDNQLDGSIPTEFNNFTKLQLLFLNDNQLTGAIPDLSALTSLTHLYLNGNGLSDPIPASLGNLTSLEQLYLYTNQLNGEIPAELNQLTNLAHLYLNDNQLTGNIPDLSALSALEYLDLNDNQLDGNIPATLGALSNLKVLSLYLNKLDGSIPTELGQLVNLTKLTVSQNQLTGNIPTELGDLANLEYLYLYNNQLDGSIPASLGNLVKLKDLYLNTNQLSGSIPAALGSLASLQRIFLNDNRLSGDIPVELMNLDTLLADQSSLCNNSLSTPNESLRDFLNEKTNPDWSGCQGNGLTLAKSADVANFDAVGDTIEYSYLVTNGSGLDMTDVAVTDSLGITVSCPSALLAAGANMTCTASYDVIQADLDAGKVDNTASASGVDSDGITVFSNIDSVSVPSAAAAGLTLTKTANVANFDAVGDIINYSFLVTNSGALSVNSLAVSDSLVTVTCPSTSLAPGASMTCTASYSVTQDDLDAGKVDNTATVTGKDALDGDVSATDSVSVPSAAAAGLTLIKSTDTDYFRNLGDIIYYNFQIINSGALTVSNIAVTDSLGITVNCGGVTTLDPGGTVTCTASYAVTQDNLDAERVDNTATAAGKDPFDNDVNSNDSSVTVRAKFFTDVDDDWLPDDWEMANFGNLDQGPKDDTDQDGVSNIDEFEAGSDPSSYRPDTPELVTPAVDAEEVELTPQLTTSAYSDPDSDAHVKTQWQVSTDPDFEDDTQMVLDVISDEALEMFDVPGLVLEIDMDYYVRVRFTDSTDRTSEWSAVRGFSTIAACPEDTDGLYCLPADQHVNCADIIEGEVPAIAECIDAGDDSFLGLEGGANVAAIDAFQAIDNIPVDNPGVDMLGLISFKAEVIDPDQDAVFIIHLDEPLEDGAKIYKWNGFEWLELLPPVAVISGDRESVTLTLADGSEYDLDGVKNGFIIDPVGAGVVIGGGGANPAPAGGGGGGGGGGCFITSAGDTLPVMGKVLALMLLCGAGALGLVGIKRS